MDSWDWAKGIDVFKALTPFILALIVYLVWHKQKEKEVIASEAKHSLLVLNEILALLSEVINHDRENIGKKFDEDGRKELKIYIKEKFLILDQKKNQLLYSMIFISDAKHDEKLVGLISEGNKKLTLDLINLERLMIRNIDKDDKNEKASIEIYEKIFEIRKSIVFSIYSTKKLLVKYALYRA
ncbi:hypothetical protein HMP0015_2409 [Acinetobacter haemolyticus ATCC 19194]|uniref:Uncharacterized protein n=1 Tax=Acinetobacter haemolyticus ATCC 19194 TaxID=707232 RepID=D4XRR7_ACIHA|nr:hypothetical protein [Acinetobacter haemolyticus]EFF82127.1 hypothetical protein HMP0015_2409 [Acinetobacter haemolyticus ATCC 19194]